MNRTLKQFVKYALVGAIGAVVTSYGNIFFQRLGVPEYLTLFELPVPWALGFAIVAAMVSNFVLNKWWTFGGA